MTEMEGTSKLKWLVYGHSGWVGTKFCECLQSIDGEVVLANARADDTGAVSDEFDKVRPDRVVSLIGRMHGPGNNSISWLEEPGHLLDNVRDNLFGPVVLAHEAKKRDVHLTYFGSGCIFNSTDSKGHVTTFTEEDLPNFTGSDYAVMKGTTDQLMRYFENNVLNCRIRIPIAHDHSPRNFVTKIISFKKIYSVTNSMTVLDNILPLIVDMASRGLTGTYNMTNPGAMSHDEVLQMYKEIVDNNFKWENFREEELQDVLKGSRSNSIMDTTKLAQTCPSLLPVQEALRQSLLTMSTLK